MNNRISTQPHCFVSVVGPLGSGKTRLIAHMIANQAKLFSPGLDKTIYFIIVIPNLLELFQGIVSPHMLLLNLFKD